MKLPWKFRFLQAWELIVHGTDTRYEACLNELASEGQFSLAMETEAKQAREFIAAIVIGNGGEINIPDTARIEVGPRTVIEVFTDRENRLTRLRAK